MTSSIALLIAGAAFLTHDFFYFQNKIETKLRVLGEVIADNSDAAISFDDAAAAHELLKSLDAEPHIVSAVIYKIDGSVFASYGFTAAPPQSPSQIPGKPYVKDGFTHLYQPILLEDRPIGILYLISDRKEVLSLLGYYMMTTSWILLICALVAFAVATKLQGTISEPILYLTEITKKVTHEKDFSLRAMKYHEDEIGMLTNHFNNMLSEIQAKQDALQEANAQLERSNQELEQFAYIASHDLQEPLRVVSSYVDLLSRRYKDQLDGTGVEFIGYIHEGSIRAQELIRDLLEFARIGPKGREFVKTDMSAVLKRALANLKIQLDEANAQITHDPLPSVWADGLQITQLFQNLISNAVKYRSQNPIAIHISSEEQEMDWVFSVKDNGLGIEPQYHDRIFRIFQRLHHKTEYSGTGIGLAICKKIIERHSGKIWVESESGNGSTFKFTLSKQFKPLYIGGITTV